MFIQIEKGEHIQSSKIYMYKCKELFLAIDDGYLDSSGELLDATTIHVASVGDAIRFVY
jgi:hypothetical protein